jgi:molecular chaperone HscA
MVQAAKRAGFEGYVGTIVESTAAALSYGLFTKPLKHSDEKGKIIMVFDMGGGTTDVTIAQMVPSENQEDPTFKVLGTAGERRLGGDDMDLKLAEFVKHKIDSKSENGTGISYELRMECRTAKEALCGDGKDELPASKTRVRLGNDSVVISQEEFMKAIAPIVSKASELVESALNKCECTAASVDEVILVGGATRTPSIRTMLQSKFRNELCYSIDPYAAVAQGAAIQCAIQSELVPKHELRNALMLDALPHPIGVLVHNDNGELYVPILEPGMELPAMNYATFRLDHVRQKGVTVIAVEDVDDDLPLERIGEFTFLLHRLSDEQYQSLEKDGRTIDVGMTVDRDGKFIVSIFDKNDPEHLVKKAKYQKWKRGNDNDQQEKHVYSLGEMYGESQSLTREDLRLLACCIALFVLYVAVKLGFELGVESVL